MKKDIERYELIEKYLKGILSEAEENSFRKLLAENPGMETEIQRHRELLQLLEVNSELSLKEDLNKIHRAHLMRKFGRNGLRNLIVPVVLLAVLIAFLISYHYSKYNRQQHSAAIAKDTSLSGHDPLSSVEIPPLPRSSVTAPSSQNTRPESTHKQWRVTQKKETAQIIKGQYTAKNDTTTPTTNPLQALPQTLPPAVSPEKTRKSEPTIKESLPAVNIDSCSSDSVTAGVAAVVASCSQSATGSISLDKDHISGGQPPYMISIDGKKHFYNEFTFTDLPSAKYPVWIKDHRNCLYDLGDFFVPAKPCVVEDIFSPNKGERWEIPNYGGAGHLRIYTPAGRIVYELQLESQQTYYWDGLTINGQSLPMGVYPFTIDMDSGEKVVGNVTVVK